MKPCEDKCACPGCKLAEHLRETIANGFPPDLIVPMVLDTLSEVVAEYGINAIVREVTDFESGTVH
jgi:hypothetical protein